MRVHAHAEPGGSRIMIQGSPDTRERAKLHFRAWLSVQSGSFAPEMDLLPDGFPPEGFPPEGFPPEGFPPDFPPDGFPPSGFPPRMEGAVPTGLSAATSAPPS